jgi:hypothetical protein
MSHRAGVKQLRKARHTRHVGILIAGLVVFACVYSLVLGVYQSEDALGSAVFSSPAVSEPDHIDVYATLTSIEPLKGTLAVRLQFDPAGSLESPEDQTLTRDVFITTYTSSGKAVYSFQPGDVITPLEITLNLYSKPISDYPFDSHYADLALSVSSVDVPDGHGVVSSDHGVVPAKPSARTAIPIALDLNDSVSGYKVTAGMAADARPGFTDIAVEINRSLTAIGFACFIMILTWLLALSALVVALAVIFGGRKAEYTLLSWLAVLLFALPPLRNTMPGVPPIGSLTDFIAFFWAECIVAVSLIAVVAAWFHHSRLKS